MPVVPGEGGGPGRARAGLLGATPAGTGQPSRRERVETVRARTPKRSPMAS